MKLITLHLLAFLFIYAVFTFIALRHKFFLSAKMRLLICLGLLAYCAIVPRFLPRVEPEALLTAKHHLYPISVAYAAIMLPILGLKLWRSWRDHATGKTIRDLNEDRRRKT